MLPIRIFLSAIFLCLGSVHAMAGDFGEDLVMKARLGYNLGGTAPVGLPASIRKLNAYHLQPNVSIGIDAQKPIKGPWSVLLGLKFEGKGMHEDAGVKNYYEEIVRDKESLAGRFTGDVTTEVREWMFTVPLQAVWSPSKKIDVRFGPYFSVLTSKSFTGHAHNGYLRVGDPTGPKVIIGDDENTRGNYNFSEHMRPLQWGLDVGADWNVNHQFGIYADISWGLSGVHESSFKTIEQTLYPIFGALGVTYRIR
ncbi:MAG: porin family protein [Prevotella sp.]|jgi:hypothetical protein